MRGKEQIVKAFRQGNGITPAYAGKSGKFRRLANQVGDHPRLCGEKSFFLLSRCIRIGSPPPMRGKAGVIHVPQHLIRITPAYAGKSD